MSGITLRHCRFFGNDKCIKMQPCRLATVCLVKISNGVSVSEHRQVEHDSLGGVRLLLDHT